MYLRSVLVRLHYLVTVVMLLKTINSLHPSFRYTCYLGMSPYPHIPLEHHFTADGQWSQQTMRQPKLATPSTFLGREGTFLCTNVEDNRFSHGLERKKYSISNIDFEIKVLSKDNAV